MLKLSPADQMVLTLSDPETFSSIPHWGRHGWTYVLLDYVDAGMFKDLLHKAWRLVAPKKLIAAFETTQQ